MNTKFIKEVNRFLRNTRPYLDENGCCSIFQSGDLLEIGFLNKQCRNDLSGACLMCDYGRAKGQSELQIYLDEMQKILKEYSAGVNFLLICSNGSILDEYQVSTELLTGILNISQACNIPNIIIETHYKDVTKDRLDLINKWIHKPVILEMGLETVNTDYQNLLFMKNIEIIEYEKTIRRIHNYGYDIEINLMLGLPFLSPSKQIEDVKQSIDWVIDRKCTPVIFPVNIKPHTMLKYIYDKGLYQPISLWLLIILLDDLPPQVLSKIIIAWYGNRDEPYPNDIPTILPQTCNKCRDSLLSFGRQFLNTNQYKERKKLISDLINNTSCNCYMVTKRRLYEETVDFEKKYNQFYEKLQTDFKNLINEAKN